MQTPTTPTGTNLTRHLAAVCEEDRGGSPFGWDETTDLLAWLLHPTPTH